ncbi:MAG: glycosyltransferase family 2 protein [Phycisphaerae bacterium]|nr:glycosyltransferase family 2 protein [Phycisphaerae bacterium]
MERCEATSEACQAVSSPIVTLETHEGPCADDAFELTVLMPCLDEAETLERCIRTAQGCLNQHGIRGEVLVADNGSTDGSVEIARRCGARVVNVPARGYGNALRAGSEAARGQYIIMGDADCSYDFSALMPFVEKLRAGNDLVMGTRLRGRIMPGAMPWKHRWIGNPVLTGLGRLFFGISMSDFHAGLRGYTKRAFKEMDLQTTGMEFASEMVIKARLKNMKMDEVPITLYPDGRSRRPHLRSWRDGWRHLRFMLCYSPRWLFLYPGTALFAVGALILAALAAGPRTIGGVTLDTNTLAVGGLMSVVGFQVVVFALFSSVYAVSQGLLSQDQSPLAAFRKHVTLEAGVCTGLMFVLVGVGSIARVFHEWWAGAFGPLDPSATVRFVVLGVVLVALGVQAGFSSFLLSILGMTRRHGDERRIADSG